MSPTLLAVAWGALVSSPFVLAARRASTRGRVRALGAAAGSEPRSRRMWMPTVVRRLERLLRDRRHRRRETQVLGRELPLVLDLLQVAVSAGCTPYRAIELAVQWGPPVSAAAFQRALDSTRVGSGLGVALDAVSHRLPTLAPVTDVLRASDQLGAPAGPALTRLAHEVRADLRREAEARARTLPVKLLFPLVFLVLPAFGLLTVVPALLAALART